MCMADLRFETLPAGHIMSKAIERSPDITCTDKTEAVVEQRMPRLQHAARFSLFAMAAWKRMLMGLGALLCLWLTILWATRG